MAQVGIDIITPTAQQPHVISVDVQHRESAYYTTGNPATGIWSAVTAYVAGDIATWSEEDWIALVANTNVLPGTDPATWVLAELSASWVSTPTQPLSTTPKSATVQQKVSYDLRLRYQFADGTASPWTTVTNHTVAGKTTPPNDVTGFKGASTKGNLATILSWDPNLDPDLWHYEIRKGGTTWDTATLFSTPIATVVIINLPKPAGATYWIKAVDTSGNYSLDAASTVILPPSNLSVGTGPITGLFYNAGDVIIYNPPVPGNAVGIRATVAGNPATWEEFGLVSPDLLVIGTPDTLPDLWNVGLSAAAPAAGNPPDAYIESAPALGDPLGGICTAAPDTFVGFGWGSGMALASPPAGGVQTDWNVVVASDVPDGPHVPTDAFIYRDQSSPGGFAGGICVTGGATPAAQTWYGMLPKSV